MMLAMLVMMLAMDEELARVLNQKETRLHRAARCSCRVSVASTASLDAKCSMATGDTAPLAIGQELTVARDVVLGQVQNVPMSEDSTPTPSSSLTPTPSPAPSPRVEQSDESSKEDGGDAKIYSLEHARARCVRLPRPKRLKRTKTVEARAKAVK